LEFPRTRLLPQNGSRLHRISAGVCERSAIAEHGKRLEYFTIGWNPSKGLRLVAGALAGSISLVGFSMDSFIEVTSAVR